jgi:hypothetical protein
MVAMKLHNLCVDRSDTPPVHQFNDDVREGDQWVVYNNYRDDDVELRG